jgi:hypothetical protein
MGLKTRHEHRKSAPADASATAKDSRKSLRKKLMTLRSNKKKQRSKSMLKT